LIRDHLLVDHDSQRLTGEQLAGMINAVGELRGGACHAALMRSCITDGRHDIDVHGR
jgi:hypothetical protein